MPIENDRSIPVKLITAVLASTALATTAGAFQVSTTIESLGSAGAASNHHSYSNAGCISGDGRFVAFGSTASNLVTGDTNQHIDVFVRDRTNATTERVSVSTGGSQGSADSYYPSVSSDGRFVTFESLAPNLVAVDTNGYTDVFVRDRTNGTTELVSVSSSGVQGLEGSYGSSMSATGRYVAFHSDASNLVTGDLNTVRDIFVRDRTLGTTQRVSVGPGGVEADSVSEFAAISGDGRFVAFISLASNLVAGDNNGTYDVFVRNRIAGTNERVSISSLNVEADAYSYAPQMSGDGRYVAFQSYATNLVLGDTNALPDIFVRDRSDGTTECVSLAGGGLSNGLSESCAISPDGRFVAFSSEASNLVTGDTNGWPDVFVRDRVGGSTERASVDSAGVQANHESAYPAISADNRFVAFQSRASNLVVGDTNARSDVFVRDRGPQAPIIYCTAGTSSNGCIASIYASTNPSLSLANPCTVTVFNVEGQKSGIQFYGINNTGYIPPPWAPGSTSLLCVKHPTQRTPLQNSGGSINSCSGTFALDWNAYQTSHPTSLGNPWAVGAKIYVQAWFRDPLAVKSTNMSNALEMTYTP